MTSNYYIKFIVIVKENNVKFAKFFEKFDLCKK